MTRRVLSNAQWAIIDPIALGRHPIRGKQGATHANLPIYGVCLWAVHTRAQLRELQGGFGRWNFVFKRFRSWTKTDAFYHVFRALEDSFDKLVEAGSDRSDSIPASSHCNWKFL